MSASALVLGSLRGFDRILRRPGRSLRSSRRLSRAVIEVMEPRILLSTFQVTSALDNTGSGSTSGTLRYEIQQADNAANSTGDVETITFASTVTGTLTLGRSNGALVIDNTAGQVIVQGPGARTLNLTAKNRSAVFTIDSNSTAQIQSLTISYGFTSYGGGIINHGSLVVSDCIISGNKTERQGAGIYNVGYLAVEYSTITANEGVEDQAVGGGIANRGRAVITNSTISGNYAITGAGIYNDAGGDLSVIDSTISGNVATGEGAPLVGGIQGNATLDGTIVADSHGTDLYGSFTGKDDLIDDGSGLAVGTNGNIKANPYLSPLGYYGGPTPTQIPLSAATSPIITGGFSDPSILLDQRGLPRPGSSPEIGAFQTDPLQVNTNQDDPVEPGQVSLRDAIHLADTLASFNAGDLTITFASTVTGTINLNSAALQISNSGGQVTIQGPGANLLAINAGGLSQVFTTGGYSNAQIENLEITGGAGIYGGYDRYSGAGIYNQGNLTVRGCIITGNSVTPPNNGAGIDNYGELALIDSTISDNSAEDGGGIFNSGSATISYSTLTGNTAAAGGAIDSSGSLAVVNSTIYGNIAPYGGGINNLTSGQLTVTDSTIANNVGHNKGGGLHNKGEATITGTIIADNTGSSDVNGTISSGSYDLIGDGSGGLSGPTILTNVNPMLAPLGYYGGPTETMPLLPESPAINAVPAGEPPVDTDQPQFSTDQRGLPRPSLIPSDIGAFEADPLYVNTLQDGLVGSKYYLSLREAISLATLYGGDQTITFASNLSGDIDLSGPLAIYTSGDITIQGLGANELTINGQGGPFADFSVGEGSTVYIEDLKITGGEGNPINPHGGGISNNGRLTITDCIISGNSAGRSGGGVYDNGYLTVSNSTICNNSTNGAGGGICVVASENNNVLRITNSTISGNSAQFGGGISNYAFTAIIDCTISGNTATVGGGGISNDDGNVLIYGTIVANSNGGDLSGDFVGNYNLIDDGTGISGGLSLSDNLLDCDPLLAPLGNYGGSTPTMALLPSSPALNTGASLVYVGTDQRGVSRPQNQAPDIGAFESQGFALSVINGDNQSTGTNSPFATGLEVQVKSNDPSLTNLTGGQITFVAPGSGPSATVANPVAVNASGDATVYATANSIVGSYYLSATSGADTGSAALFSLTNTPTAPPALTLSGNDSTKAGATYSLSLSSQFPPIDIGDGIESWTINWGDGSLAQTIIGDPFLSNSLTITHVFKIPTSSLTISASATDVGGYHAASNTVPVSVSAAPITLTSAAAASPSPVSGTSTQLTVGATDSSSGSDLEYAWSATVIPIGVQGPTFSDNEDNAAYTTTATFYAAGSYTFLVTIEDGNGDSITSTTTVNVTQTPTSISVAPTPITVPPNSQNNTFLAMEYDQFDMPMASQPAFAWSCSDPHGTISADGVYTAGNVNGTYSVSAIANSLSGTASVTVGSSSTSGLSVTPVDISAIVNQVFTGTVASFTDSYTDIQDYRATVVWGDGNSSPGEIAQNGSQWTVIGINTYASAGIFQPSVEIRDIGGNDETVKLVAAVSSAHNSTDLRATATTYGTIDLTWVDDQGSGAQYDIDRSTDGVNFSELAIVAGNPVTGQLSVYEDSSGLTPNTTYFYRVNSVNDDSDASVASAVTATGTGYSATPLETDTILVTGVDAVTYEMGDAIQSTAVLQPGVHYELVATGQMDLSYNSMPANAEYRLDLSPGWMMDATGAGQLSYGIGVDDPVSEQNRYPYWGPYDPDNTTGTYEIDLVGTGEPITLNYHDDLYSDNYQSNSTLHVQIFQQLPESAPAAPQGLVATPQGTDGINLTWPVGGEGDAQEYLLFRSTTAAKPASPYITLPAVDSTQSTQSYTDTSGLSAGTSYYYWIEASNSNGTSGAAGAASAALNLDTPILAQVGSPAPITGTSVNVAASGTDPSGDNDIMTYHWTVYSGPTAGGVLWNDGGLTPISDGSISTTSSSVTATFNEAGTYVFSVTASDANGMSNVQYITVDVEQSLTSLAIQTVSSTVYNGDTDVVNGNGFDQFGNAMPLSGSYSWSVETGGIGGTIVANASVGGQAIYTAPASADGTDTIMMSIAGLTGAATVSVISENAITVIVRSTDWINLSWNVDESAQYYQVFRGASAGFIPDDDTLVADDWTATSFDDDEVSAGTTYYYQIYAVNANNSLALVGQTSGSTPAIDSSLYPIPSDSGSDAESDAPSSVTVTGINDMELLVSWTNNAQNPEAFDVQISTDQSNWYDVQDGQGWLRASAAANTFIIRGMFVGASLQYLQEGTAYYVRVCALNSAIVGGVSAWTIAGPAELFVPPFSATIVIVGGRHQEESWLERGWNSPGYSVGTIAGMLAAQGFNVFLTADSPSDGGAITLDAQGGTIYSELLESISRGDAGAIGLIGYSWGGGVISDLSTLLWNDESTDGLSWVVYAGTIDAVDTGLFPEAVKVSPAFSWESGILGDSFSEGLNYWEPTGGGPFGAIGGAPMSGATNYEIFGDNHSTIQNDWSVLFGIYTGALDAFESLAGD